MTLLSDNITKNLCSKVAHLPQQVGKENPELNKLCELTCEIRHKEECASFKNTLDPNKLLPGIYSS